MSVLSDVFGSLRVMSLLQLLLAFFACIGYALAQGHLVGDRGRRFAVAIGGAGAIGFVFESREWMQATMLLAFAIAGMGVFTAAVWLTSRSLGLARAARLAEADGAIADVAAQPAALRALQHPTGGHAHSTL